MSTSCGGVNCTLGDGSVRAFQPTTLAALARQLQQPGEPARTMVSGADLPVLRALLDGLRRHGASITAPVVRPSAEPMPVLMVIADQRDVASGSALLFLVSDAGPRSTLLLPAVQAAREAARRATRGGAVGLVLVQRPPGPGPRLATEIMSFNFAKVD